MKTYTIREIGELTGLSSSTLRYYEEEGILRDVGRTENHQRIYTERHLGRLRTLLCFKGTGMSIQQLKQFFQYEENEEEHLEEILELLSRQREKVLEGMEQLARDLKQVERKLCFYGAMKDARDAGEKKPDWDSFWKENDTEILYQ